MAVALPSWLLIERPAMRARKAISISIEARIDRLHQRLKSKSTDEMPQHTGRCSQLPTSRSAEFWLLATLHPTGRTPSNCM
jgi:hypothetical protein